LSYALGSQLIVVGATRAHGCNDTSFFHHLNKNTNIYINIYFTAVLRDKIKKGKQNRNGVDDTKLQAW
jgi:hypothetical protein